MSEVKNAIRLAIEIARVRIQKSGGDAWFKKSSNPCANDCPLWKRAA